MKRQYYLSSALTQKITTQQLDKFNEKIEENANIIERPEKQNHDFSESLNSFH